MRNDAAMKVYRMHAAGSCRRPLYVAALVLFGAACGKAPEPAPENSCPADRGGLSLPQGFCAAKVADNLGFVRHIAAGPDGRLYVTLRNQRLGLGGLLQLDDRDGDGRFTHIERISDEPGMGIGVHGGYLYFGAEARILRYPLSAAGVDAARMEVVVDGFPEAGRHSGKTLAFDPQGGLYVNLGAPGNACQAEEGVPGSPGRDPCPELDLHAAIWRFAADRTGQHFPADGVRYGSGIRNAYALDWHAASGALHVVQHGRDGLHELWPQIISAADGAELPAEEFLRVEPGSTHGWPYCYLDPRRGGRVLAPEYGGDGSSAGRCAELPPALLAFPAHYSPNALAFNRSTQFPPEYAGGAFIAFHGSYDRGNFDQVGFQVVFVPYRAGKFSQDWSVFAGGFAGAGPVARPEDAEHRPTGLAFAPDGSLFVSDSVQGTIWRIWYSHPEQ